MTTLYDAGAESLVRRRVKRVALAAVAQNSMAFTWQNPEDKKIVVTRVVVDITTAASAAATMDVGVVANAAATDAGIFSALALNSVAITDHLKVAGAGIGGVHKVDEKDGTNDWITGKTVGASGAGLVGYAYIEYLLVEG